jgi:ABC-type glycerol-3-phosphate transport system substrate-binding protein
MREYPKEGHPMQFRKITIVACLLIFTFLVAACGGDGSSSGGSSNDKSTAEPVKQTDPASQPASIVIYDRSGEKVELLMDKYGNKLKEKFPNWTFKIIPQQNSKTLGEVITAGEKIDVMVASTASALMSYKLQNDISDLIAKDKMDLNRFEPTTIELQRKLANGGIYGLPTWTSSLILYYNKDLFDQFAVSYPKENMTWDELYELAKKMTRTEAGKSYKGLTMAFDFGLMLNQFEAPLQDSTTGKALFLEENFKKAFQNQVRFYQITGNEVPGSKYFLDNQQSPFYKDKTVAMFLTLSGAEKTYKDSVNWDVAPFPIVDGKPGIGSQSYPTYIFMASTSQNRSAAFQVMKYFTSDEFQSTSVRSGFTTILKDTAIMKDFAADLPYVKGKNIKAMIPQKYAAPTIKMEYNDIAKAQVLSALDAVSKGTDVNSALRDAAERNDKQVAEQDK